MEQRKWFDSTQPQTLQSAVMLSYLNAALSFLFALLSFGSSTILLAVVLCGAVGAIGIANEKRWGFRLCLAAAVVYGALWLLLILVFAPSVTTVLNLLVAVILVVLLLHPQSREYRRIWFH